MEKNSLANSIEKALNQKKKLAVVFTVDDVAPTRDEGLLREFGNLGYLKKLNEEFGCRFTLFIIPVFFGNQKYSLENNPKFVDYLKSQNYLSCELHGLTHIHSKNKDDAREFADLNENEVMDRINTGKTIMNKVGFIVKCIKSPGWYSPLTMYYNLPKLGIEVLGEHSFGHNTYTLTNGLILIPYTYTINDIRELNPEAQLIILHSHISKGQLGTNKNDWNDENYEKVRQYLLKLKENYELEFLTLYEAAIDKRFRK